MTILQIILTIIWLSAGTVSFYCNIKGGQLFNKLREEHLVTDSWVTSIGIRRRALRTLLEKTADEEIKKQAQKAILYFRISERLVWGSFLLILVLMLFFGANEK